MSAYCDLPRVVVSFVFVRMGIVEGFWRLYTDDFYDIRLPVPPVAERQAIIEYVCKTTSNIDRAVDGAESEIALLREYRTRLIADLVTGKLDVREAAAKLPDEVPEAEPLDEIEDVMQDDSVAEDIDIEAADAA